MKLLISFFLTINLLFSSLFAPTTILAQDNSTAAEQTQETKTVINFFYSETCPHCKTEAPFLEYLQQTYPEVEVHSFETTRNPANAQLMMLAAEKLNIEAGGVPLTIIGDQHMIGYGDDQTHGAYLEHLITQCRENTCLDILANETEAAPIQEMEHQPSTTLEQPTEENTESAQLTNKETEDEQLAVEATQPNQVAPPAPMQKISVPFFGDIDPMVVSLPVLTVVIGLLDGFNPCAMWALIFLISLLLGMKDKRRRWILGTAFILTSGLVYFLFMTAWLNFFLLVGWIWWIRLAIGALAIGAGVYNLRDFVVNKSGACSTEGSDKKKKIIDRLSMATRSSNLIFALLSIMLLAAGVNLIELFCSAGFPAIYTQVLSLSDLATWQYYSYLGLYIFMFILDDLVLFVATMLTMHMTGLDTKYARFSRLIGGALILLIGLALMFKPELLMFQ